jgi:hypothetical protein
LWINCGGLAAYGAAAAALEEQMLGATASLQTYLQMPAAQVL